MHIYVSKAACATVLFLFTMGASALGPALETVRLAPGDLKWAATPAGTPRAHLAGDDKKAGLYADRFKLPANFRKQPHFHPDDRVVTVMSGTLYVGFGEHFDESKMKALPAGSIWTEPAKQSHFVWAKDGEVVIQVIGNGPSGETFIQQKK